MVLKFSKLSLVLRVEVGGMSIIRFHELMVFLVFFDICTCQGKGVCVVMTL